MLKWADIPAAAKMTLAVVPVLAGLAGWLFATFETASASDEKWAQHNQAITCRTVYELRSEIREHIKRLEFDKSLDFAARDWLNAEIRALQDEIKRLDPNGRC